LSDIFDTIMAAESASLGWLAIAILVLLAFLSRKPQRKGKRTSN